MIKKAAQPDFSQAVNLTRHLGNDVATRGTPATRVLSGAGPQRAEFCLSTIQVSPHSVTHCDLRGIRRHRGDEAALDYTEFELGELLSAPCVVIDVGTARRARLDAFLGDPAHGQLFTDGSAAKVVDPLRVDPHSFVDLLVDMSVSAKEIETALDDCGLGGKRAFVLLHTGWDQYRPSGDTSLNYPHLECWHPYLMGPYLDWTAVQALRSRNCVGVGSDSPSLECPLYFVDKQQPLGFQRLALDSFTSSGLLTASNASTVRLPEDELPVHDSWLADRRVLLEHLLYPPGFMGRSFSPRYFDGGLGAWTDTDAPLNQRVGQLAVIPLPYSRVADAQLVVALFFLA